MNWLLSKLKNHPPVSFAEFMQWALYDPEHGYYTVQMNVFGNDFTTAPEMGPLFSYSLANQCVDILAGVSYPKILEFGAGSGRLCIDLLSRLEQLNALPDVYYILELSGCLQAQQRQAIETAIPHLFSKIIWLNAWPDEAIEGIIIANEVLDAMPVHRFLKKKDQILEVFVDVHSEGHLIEITQDCQNERLLKQVNHVVPPQCYPYQSEVNLLLEDWLKQCATCLSKGLMLIIDYGFPQHEYYHPDRHQGTLMCHYQHRAHSNPLVHIGEQDITAHVDFTHVAEAAIMADFSVAGFTSQASFLLANGLLSLVNEVDPKQLFNQQQAIKTLVQPNEMGELFKVMALTKHWNEPLRGFQMQDRRAGL
ncbi:MAG: SAM-dependent methyltransferase [Gammaproteobacteria bacterium]|nr:SAM-dependent methyltransferase [Gammaproteobacteria bacterium]